MPTKRSYAPTKRRIVRILAAFRHCYDQTFAYENGIVDKFGLEEKLVAVNHIIDDQRAEIDRLNWEKANLIANLMLANECLGCSEELPRYCKLCRRVKHAA